MLGTQGRDRTGAVLVRLAEDRLPGWIWVAPDWPDRLEPEQFCGAVLAAARDAAADDAAARDAAVRDAAARDAAVRDAADDAAACGAVAGDGRPGGPAPRAADPEPVTARRPDVIVEDLLRLFAYAADLPPSAFAPPSGTGSAYNGALTVTVSHRGLDSCAARPDWVAECRAATLVDALGSALAAARADLARAPRPPDLGVRIDTLYAELRTATRAAAYAS